MANYIITECLTYNEYIVSAATLNPGDTIGFFVGEDPYCGTVREETIDLPNSSYVSEYSDCCECLERDGREPLNFTFILCDTEESIDIEATNFCSEYGTPKVGETYQIQYGGETPFCAIFKGLIDGGETNYHYVSGPYKSCDDCVEEIPRSAGTEYEICEICCDCGSTGSTINILTPPHPVYTDGYNIPVTQLNMVTLGGPNGLNS